MIAGAGAAGIGIARLIRLAMIEDGATPADAAAAIAMVDSRGLVHEGRPDLDADKVEVARPAAQLELDGFASVADGPPSLRDVVRVLRPTVLLGATGMPGTFNKPVIEAIPADILRWSDGNAIVATGSPFAPVEYDGRRHEIGQANNVFVFPGLGLGAIVAEASSMTDRLFLVAARTLAGQVSDEQLATGSIYPRVDRLREVTRAIAVAVASAARADGLARLADHAEVEAEVDGAMWWPDYVPYLVAQDRRAGNV